MPVIRNARQSKLAGLLGLRRDLRHFLASTLDLEGSRRLLKEAREARAERFLETLRLAVFEVPKSPYLPLFQAASVDLSQLQDWLKTDTVEAVAERLFDAGVRLSVKQFRGLEPIDGYRLNAAGSNDVARAEDFDLSRRGVTGTTGGSTGPPRRVVFDLGLLEHEAAAHRLFLEAFGLADMPLAVWRPTAPGVAGIKKVLQHLKLGRGVERWFSQYQAPWSVEGLEDRVLHAAYVRLTRHVRHAVPTAEYVPASEAATVASFMAEKVAAGTPAHLDTTASCAVRVAQAATACGLDIGGSFFRVGGEPLTQAKRLAIEQCGARVAGHYAMTEAGIIGVACADPQNNDDVHVLDNKVALIAKPAQVAVTGPSVDRLFCTTLSPHSPKLLINVEIGDHATLERRLCGCHLGMAGFSTIASSIGSYEKLTSEGLNVHIDRLAELVETALPARFGGTLSDYQFVECESDGLPYLELRIAPSVGPLDPVEPKEFVLHWLSGTDARLVTAQWRAGNTLRVVRGDIAVSGAGKVLPLVRGSAAP